MAKVHHTSGSDPMSADVAKRKRNAGSGRCAEASAIRGDTDTAPDATAGPPRTGKPVSRLQGVTRPARSAQMVEAVLHAADDEGLTVAKDGRIAGRVSSELIARAKARTGLISDTELLEFALANVAIEDGFAEAFHSVRGTIDPDTELGF